MLRFCTKKALNKFYLPSSISAGAKAHVDFAPLAARLLIRQENSEIAFPPISAKDAEMDGAPSQYLVAESIKLCPFKTSTYSEFS
jgi:hypothetical protein